MASPLMRTIVNREVIQVIFWVYLNKTERRVDICLRFVCCNVYYVITFEYYCYIYHDIINIFISNNLMGCLYYKQTKITCKKQYIVSFQWHPGGYEGDKVLFNSVMEDDVPVIRM